MKTETEPKQTAMQRLIEQLDLHIKTAYDRGNLMTVKAYEHSRALAHTLLPEERKQIEEAYNLGSARTEYDDGFGMNLTISSEQYFTTKFKQ